MLQAYPDAEGNDLLLHTLYAWQRLDAGDVLGEHAATMALVRAFRNRLAGENPPAPVRAAAEAALVAEVREALRVESYETAETLLSTYVPLTEGTEARRSLALSAASLDEQAGRPEEALMRVEAVLAELSPEDERLAEALQVVAGLLEESAGGAGRPGSAAGTDGPSGAATVGEGAVLLAPYPNPAQAVATVPLNLTAAVDVRVAVYDVLGRRVATLHEGPLDAGAHALSLDATALPAGVYVVRVTAPGFTATQRLTVVR